MGEWGMVWIITIYLRKIYGRDNGCIIIDGVYDYYVYNGL